MLTPPSLPKYFTYNICTLHYGSPGSQPTAMNPSCGLQAVSWAMNSQNIIKLAVYVYVCLGHVGSRPGHMHKHIAIAPASLTSEGDVLCATFLKSLVCRIYLRTISYHPILVLSDFPAPAPRSITSHNDMARSTAVQGQSQYQLPVVCKHYTSRPKLNNIPNLGAWVQLLTNCYLTSSNCKWRLYHAIILDSFFSDKALYCGNPVLTCTFSLHGILHKKQPFPKNFLPDIFSQTISFR